MIVAFATHEIDPPDMDGFNQWVVQHAAKYREEPGCVLYEVFVDPLDPRKRRQIEVWETEEHLAAHRRTPLHDEAVHMYRGAGLKNLKDYVFEATHQIHMNEVENLERLERERGIA